MKGYNMRKFLILGICALGIVTLSACSTQRFDINPNPIMAQNPSYEGTNHFILWGISQVQTMRPGAACGPQGVNRVEVQETFLDGLFGTITLGLYAPRHYAVYCNDQL